jgi:hypothetical protein
MQPLPDAVVATLKSDACAALAAIMVISSAHSELLAWAQRSLSKGPGDTSENSAGPTKNANGNKGRQDDASENSAAKPDGGEPAKRRSSPRKVDAAAYQARRLVQRDADDQRLIAAMRLAPLSSIREWGAALGKSRTAIVQGLHRLRDAGRIERDGGAWALAEASTNAQPPPPWIEPLSGGRVARHAADGRVRGELTSA